MVPKLLGRHVRVAATFARFARLARYFALFSDAARSLVEGIRLNRAANVHKAMNGSQPSGSMKSMPLC